MILVRSDIWPFAMYKSSCKNEWFCFSVGSYKETYCIFKCTWLLCWLAPHLSSSLCSFHVTSHAHSFPLYNVLMPTLNSFCFKCGGGGEGCFISTVLMTYWTISPFTQLTFFWESNMTLIGFWNKSIFLVVIRGIYDLFYKKKKIYMMHPLFVFHWLIEFSFSCL